MTNRVIKFRRRVIKFRVWDRKMQKMFTDPIVFNGGWYENREAYETDWSSRDDRKGKFLMQFTELQDCNGEDIYESDILECVRLDKFGLKIFPGGFVITWDESKNGWVDFHPKDEFEVIGNIHENPDLLS